MQGIDEGVTGLFLKIDAQQLLLTSEHAHLEGGGMIGIADQVTLDAALLEQLTQVTRALVLTDDASERHACAKGYRITCHVGRTAQAIFATRDVDDGHRGLRRNPLNFAKPVAIEHDVTHHKHAGS